MSFTQQVITGASAESDYIYYNAVVVNNQVKTTQDSEDPQIFFQDTRQNPLIKDTSKYVVSVDNFTINGGQKNLPILIPQIVPNQADFNYTIYTVSFGWQNAAGTKVLATVPITWVPEVQVPWVPVPPSAFPRQFETPYYYCYTYQHFLNLVNNALTAAWRDVMYKVKQPVIDGGLGLTAGTTCPFFEFDPNTGLFSLCQDANTSWLPYGTAAQPRNDVADATTGSSDPLAPYIPFGVSAATGYGSGEFSFVGFNSNLEGLLTNFDTVYYGGGDAIFGDTSSSYGYVGISSTVQSPDVAAGDMTAGNVSPVFYPENIVNVIPDQRGGSIFTLSPPYPPTNSVTLYYIRETQDYISTGTLWSPVASIVLATASIPVRFEGNAAPLLIGESNEGGTTASTGAAQKVLLETPINALTADMWRGFIEYKPLTPLFSALDPSHDGLSNLDVRVLWRNRFTNELIPLRMYNSGTMNLRLRFLRKSA